ncbi:hypothetical protein QBC33DRAFT_574654 [Phialemonium atrogriseum]|uniref:DUF6604 domain-containing protein n=1 Tax=Phialemonium atrogriseum TaxID=1093897 RepID=A0AAJ0BP06_9PEZI|nr:uncharacterized protein QBC33DRAFT_574654 [Phialemonium atrogriseum]KAK1761825.1 hypothetical protein QBC33DRAFT_574654 [Phialemonium atrogriseum]
MLPNPLISIYQLYKQDTDSVASWLASTAKACGYPSDLLPNNNGDTAKKTPGRPKGKARSKAKKKGPGSGSGPAKVFKYIVALKDFIPLAEFITSLAKPKVAVLESFCETINRVIHRYAQSDRKHSYFVGVLEKVREVLKPRMSPLSQAATEPAPGVADRDSLANKFGALTIYEPSREFLDAPALERPQRTEEDEVIYEAEPQKSLEDALVAYTMMKLKVDHWPASNDHMLREVQRKIKWIGQEPVHNVKLKFYRKSGMPVPESMTRHRMLQYSPVLSGLILYHFRADMYDIGIAVVNAWGSITYSWQLYNALRNENLIDEPWSDMEVVQTLIGESNLFCLQMGVSAANFADPRRRRGITALGSRAGPRGIKSGIPVSSMFMDRYLRATGQVDWTPEHIDDIIARSEFELEGSADGGTLSMGQIDDPAQLKAMKAERRRQKKKAVDGARMSPEQLIQHLTMALQAETMEISFPYLMMHRWCWRLLRAVKDACDPFLRQLYTPAYMDRETQLPFVVGYIFLTASGAEGGIRDMRLLEASAPAVDGLTGTGVGAFLLKVMREKLGFNIQFSQEDEDGASSG